jgi:hypothetical protein
VPLHRLNSGELLPQLLDGGVQSRAGVFVARIGHLMVDLLLHKILVEGSPEFKSVVRVQSVRDPSSTHDAGKGLFAHLRGLGAQGVHEDLARKDVLHDEDVLEGVPTIL